MLKFFKHFTLYTIVGFLNPAINFFLTPLLSHHLLPADYGLLSLFNTYITLVIPLISVVAYALLSVEYYKEKDPAVYASKFVSIQIIPVINFIWMAILGWSLFYQYADVIELRNVDRIWVVVILLISFSTVYVDTLFTFLVIQRKVGLYTVYCIVRVLLEAGLTIWFIVYRGMGWEGRILSAFIISIIFFLLALLYFRKQGYFKGSIQWKYIRLGIMYGLPLILHTVGKVVMNQSDRLFITKLRDIEQAGIYSIGYTVGSVIMIVVNVFSNLLTPYMYERLANLTEKAKIQLVKMSYLFAGGTFTILLLLIPVSEILFTYFIDQKYREGSRYVFWIGLSYFFWGCYLLFSGYIFYYNKTRLLGQMAIVTIGCNILFNYIFISRFGAIGAAYSTTLSFFIVFVIVAYRANKMISLPWFKKITFSIKDF
ncbi:MAG TPA: polysaccharide biosynthesis C-terminal domain-containing protein [Chitinophagaceae bacterium]